MKGFVKISLLICFVFACFNTAFARDKNKIRVTVVVEKKIARKFHVFGTGFSVNNKNRGSLGRSTRKSGPRNAKYTFGFRGTRGDEDCGSAVLKRDSVVLLYFKKNKCTNKVFIKNKKG